MEFDPDWSTNWTTIYLLNMIVYIIIAISTCGLCLTFLAVPIGMCGIVGHLCGVTASFAAMVVTPVFRYNEEGNLCAGNETEYLVDWEDKEGDTFKFSDHGNMI